MASLTVRQNGTSRLIPLDGKPLTIGRLPACEILLEEPKASKAHCVIEPRGKTWVLRDLSSRNGTWLGDTRIEECELHDGVVLRIGQTFLEFRSTAPEKPITPAIPQPIDVFPSKIDLLPLNSSKPPAPTVIVEVPRKRKTKTDWAAIGLWANWLMKTAAWAILAFGIIGGGAWYYYSKAREAKEDLAQAENRKTAARNSARQEVLGLIKSEKFRDAREQINVWQGRGLDGPEAGALNSEVDAAIRESGTAQLNEAEHAIDASDAKRAERALQVAEDLNNLGFHDSRTHRLRERLTSLQTRTNEVSIKNESREQINSAQTLFEEGKYDDARSMMTAALSRMKDANERALAEKKFKDLLGGRLRLTGLPDNASIVLRGRERYPYTPTQVIVGLADGKAEGLVRAPGYVPFEFTVNVHYPDEAVTQIQLIREALPQIWALQALSDSAPACRDVALFHYTKLLTNKKLVESLRAEFPMSAAQGQVDKLPEGQFADRIKYDASKSKSQFELLKNLGTLASRHPEGLSRGLSLVWDAEHDRIADALAQVEHGCASCLGLGSAICQTCRGVGKGPGSKECPDCLGLKYKDCTLCDGTGWKTCETCHGTGRAKGGGKCQEGCAPQRVAVGKHHSKTKEESSREHQYEHERKNDRASGQSKTKTQTKSESEGRGVGTSKVVWGFACRCQHGEITCKTCNGTGIKTWKNKVCEDCQGTGLHGKCEVCGGKRSRNDMKLDKRTPIEKALAARFPLEGQ